MNDKIKQTLEYFYREKPRLVKTRFKRGDLVQKSSGLAYEIDDINIYQKLGDFEKGVIPYGPIHRALGSSRGKIWDLFQKEGIEKNGKTIVPFSRAFELGIGECLEKAVLIQLASQNGVEGFLISGLISEDKDEGMVGYHAFNVIFKNGEVRLVDAENPLRKDKNGKITHPYLAPILDINKGKFIVPDEWKQGRTYYLA